MPAGHCDTYWHRPVTARDCRHQRKGRVANQFSPPGQRQRLCCGKPNPNTREAAWPERYRNGNATTDDFIALAEEISGQDLETFFQGWLYEITLPPLNSGEPLATPVATPAP